MSTLVFILGAILAVSGSAAAEGRVLCYYAEWAYEYLSIGQFDVSNISASLCTHVTYAFAGIGAEGDIIYDDYSYDVVGDALNKFASLRDENPDLVTMISIGGYDQGSTNFSLVAANETLRATFVNNSLAFLQKYDLRGMDIDWEYPNQRDGSTAADYQNFVYLLEDLKAAFAEYDYVLSCAVGATQSDIDTSYNVTGILDAVDFVNLMAYDLHGTWDYKTGANAPLWAQPSDTASEAATLTVNATVLTWLANGASADKLNLGLGNYGHAYTLASASNATIGAPITDAAYYAPYTNDTSTWTYLELCSDQLNNTAEWTVINYNNSFAYAVKDSLWVGYDNVETMYAKGQFARSYGLGGIMFWALHGDDFLNYCGHGKWPLIQSAKAGFAGNASSCSALW